MAIAYYCLVGVLLVAVVSGQNDVPVPGQLEVLDVISEIFPEDRLRPLIDNMVGNPYLCKACMGVIEFLKNVTEDKQILGDLVDLLLPLCEWAPFQFHDLCVNYIEGIPAIVKEYADEYLNPTMDCKAVCSQPPPGMAYDTNAVPMMMINNLAKKMQARKPIN